MKLSILKSKMVIKISRSKREVFLRSDFKDMGEYSQVGRALSQLVSDIVLIRIGYGLYAKARINRINGNPMPSARGGFSQVANEALDRLNVKWEPSWAVTAYQGGRSAQIPANEVVTVFGRFNRRIRVGRLELRVNRA